MRIRSDRNLIEAWLRSIKPTLPGRQYVRGTIQFNSAESAARFADGRLIGTVFNLPVYRKASIGNGQIQYYGPTGALVAQNF